MTPTKRKGSEKMNDKNGNENMKKGRRINTDNVKSMTDIENYFSEIRNGAHPSTRKYSCVYIEVEEWFFRNSHNDFGSYWRSTEDRVRYIAKAVNHKVRQLECEQDSRTRRMADNHQQEPSGLDGWRENNDYTQSGIESALDEDSGEVLEMMKREKSWWKI
jgi:hypothetical protein